MDWTDGGFPEYWCSKGRVAVRITMDWGEEGLETIKTDKGYLLTEHLYDKTKENHHHRRKLEILGDL